MVGGAGGGGEGGGGGETDGQRKPQSLQSAPNGHSLYSEPMPPSSPGSRDLFEHSGRGGVGDWYERESDRVRLWLRCCA